MCLFAGLGFGLLALGLGLGWENKDCHKVGFGTFVLLLAVMVVAF